MSASFDLSRAPLYDTQRAELGRRVTNLVTGFLAVLAGLLGTFSLLDSQRRGWGYGSFLLPPMVITLAMIPAYRFGMRWLTRQAIRLDLGPDSADFCLDDGVTLSFPWVGKARQLTWVDGRRGQWPKLPPGMPRTHVRFSFGQPAAIPESAFDLAVGIVRGRGLRFERQPRLEGLPQFRGSEVYRIVPPA